MSVALLWFVGLLGLVSAIDNGLGLVPPHGWRSWNQFQCHIDQSLIEAQYSEMVSRSRTVDGVPTSLLDLGYHSAGIDDCWQKCNSGPGGVGFHNASGYPIVDEALFPDMRAMTAKAKTLGIKPGWYGNNCKCREERPFCKLQAGGKHDACFAGDVSATIDFGFESIKLDGCGNEKNVTHFAELFNATGKPIMIESCHNGDPPSRDPSGKVICPMNFFRSSTDIRPTYGSILINLLSTSAFNGAGLTGPGCWPYPDMLEVGVTNSQREPKGCEKWGQEGCTLNFVEARTHFAAWCIVSSPLILGNDLRDTKIMDAIWPIVSNREAIAVNEAWAGDAGVLAMQSPTQVHMQNCSWFNEDGCDHPAWMVWRKLLPDKRVALLLMNNADTAADVSVKFADVKITCPAEGCTVRDIHARRDLGRLMDFSANLGAHDSAFIIVSGLADSAELII